MEHSVQADSIPTSLDTERRELEIVLLSLERTPRLVNLLSYLADRYFLGEIDQVTEYNIATEVFGRGKTSFIASDDAIVRVETHRLRKKLKAFYDSEGRGHAVQICLPLGTYVPVFSHCAGETGSVVEPVDVSDALSALKQQDGPDEPPPQKEEMLPLATKSGSSVPTQHGREGSYSWRERPFWVYVLLATIVVALAVGGYKIFHRQDGANDGPSAQTSTPARDASLQHQAQIPNSVSVPFRMIAGYFGPPQRDNVGDLWHADQHYRGGWPTHHGGFFITRTNNPLIFRYGRDGDSAYDIPLRPGIYELHLYFLQPSETNQSEDTENKAIFNVFINGKVVLSNFDIVSDAMGRNTADERVLRDISPSADGFLHIRLATMVGTPSISAIQILDGTPHKQLPIRIISQPTPFTDPTGKLWRPDNYFLGGRYMAHDLTLASSRNPVLLPVERYGHFSYAFPVDPRDQYTVVLYFAELFFGTNQDMDDDADSRVFKVMCNGKTLLDNFNIYKEAGNLHMLQKSFFHIKPTSQGKLNIMFEPISNYATVSAIEVIDESN